MRRSDPRSESGLTLLEIVVALTVFALTTLILAGGVEFGARAWERAEARASIIDPASDVERLLARLIAAAEPPDPVGAELALHGKRESLSFVVSPRVFLTGGALKRVTLERDPAANALWLRISDLDEQKNAGRESLLLLEDVTLFKARYFEAGEAGRSGDWSPSWDEEGRLPSMVELAFTVEGDPAGTRTFAAAPRKTASAGCLLLGRENCASLRERKE